MPDTPRPLIAEYEPDDLFVGLCAEFERQLTQDDIDTFAGISGDFNPLHVDPDYASQSNYESTIVHGAFQVGLASALIGMHLPGKNVLLGGVSAKFFSPLHVPTAVRVYGEISSWNLATLSGNQRVTVFRLPDEAPVSEISMTFTLHCRKNQTQIEKVVAEPVHSSDKPRILITGASGGLGSSLVHQLRSHYEIVALHRSESPPEALLDLEGVELFRADLAQHSDLYRLGSELGRKGLYGVVHCAWPGLPRGGLLASDAKTIEGQLSAGSTQVINLARILNEHGDTNHGGRLVVVGSVAGRAKPNITLASYSLGKDVLESTIRLLAPELAPKRITANVIAPSMIQAGMNKHVDNRSLLREKSQIPLGRLCTLEDVHHSVRFLLSESSEFVSGQVIGLTGAQI